MKRFYEEFINKSEPSESKISLILKKSKINIYNKENIIIFLGEDKEKNTFNLNDLIKLEGKYKFNINDDKYKEEIAKFKSFVSDFKNLNEKLKKLISLGYTETFEYNFSLENGEIINIDGNEKLSIIIEKLNCEIKKRKEAIDTA